MKYSYLLFLSLFALLSCTEENPLLVNPPAKNETVKVRFINLAGDNQIRTLQLEDFKIENIAYANTSKALQPPSDSAYLKIVNNNNVEFELTNQVKYLRNTNYTFIALNKNTCNTCPIDTIVALRTTAAIPESATQSLIKFFNAFPDSNYKYMLKFGCPSGDAFITPQNYLQFNINPVVIETGVMSLSLVKVPINNPTAESFVNLYNLNISHKSQYSIILTKIEDKEQLLLLDENEKETTALQPLELVQDRNARIRVLNLSSEIINASKIGDSNPFAKDIPSHFIDSYRDVLVCNSMKKDTLSANINDNESTTNLLSLKVNSEYTFIVFDSLSYKANKSIIVENENTTLLNGQSSIRVVNASNSNYPLTLAMGARYEPKSNDFPFSYSSGMILSSKQNFGDISQFVKVSKGVIPINIFTATEPAKLIYSTRAEISDRKNYLLVITNDDNNNIKVILVDDNYENSKVAYLNEGIFVQVVNAIPNTENIKINFESQSGEMPLLQNAEVNFSNSIATVIENKAQNININGKSYTINPETGKRTLVIASLIDNNVQIMSNNNKPFSDPNNLQYRFINTSNINQIRVKKDTASAEPIEASVSMNSFSSYISTNRERKITYYIYDGDNPNYIHRLNDIFFTLGKSYSVIFGGQANENCQKEYDKRNPKSEPNCYFVVVQQDF